MQGGAGAGAYPEHAGADAGEHEVVHGHHLLLAAAELDASDQRAYPGGDVHDDAAGKVEDAKLRGEAAAPHLPGGAVT